MDSAASKVAALELEVAALKEKVFELEQKAEQERKAVEEEQKISEMERKAVEQTDSGSKEPTTPTTDDSTTKPAPRSRFLDLPAELRCLVYEELLVVGKIFYKHTDSEHKNSIRYRDKEYYREPYLTILRVCKSVHEEAEKIYLSKNLFVLPRNWHRCSPVPYYNWYSKPLIERSLFSERGLDYVKNLSIGLDRRDLAAVYDPGYIHDDPGYNQSTWDVSENAYDTMTEQDRLLLIHETIIEHCNYGADYVLSHLAGSRNVELDYTNAFCPMGCCRPLYIFENGWMPYTIPKSIDIIGTRSEEEDEDIMHHIKEDAARYGTARILKYCAFTFRKDDSPRWSRFKYATKQRKVRNDGRYAPWK